MKKKPILGLQILLWPVDQKKETMYSRILRSVFHEQSSRLFSFVMQLWSCWKKKKSKSFPDFAEHQIRNTDKHTCTRYVSITIRSPFSFSRWISDIGEFHCLYVFIYVVSPQFHGIQIQNHNTYVVLPQKWYDLVYDLKMTHICDL